MTDDIEYEYIVLGVHDWFSWGYNKSLAEAIHICMKELSVRLSFESLSKLTAYKYPAHYEFQVTSEGTVRWYLEDTDEKVDMSLVTRIDF